MRWIPVVLAGWMAWGLPARVLACSCLGPGVTLPEHGASGVPLNTALWIATFVTEQPVLTEFGSTEPVPMTCVSLGHTLRCRPDAELQPFTRYQAGDGQLDFTTGNARDDAAPAPPVETDRRYYSSNGQFYADSCGSSEPSGVVVLTLDGGEPMLVVDATGGTDPGAPNAPVTHLFAVGSQQGTNEAWIGTWMCANNRATKPGDRFPLRVGAFDIAGNFSGWVRLTDAAIPYAPPGCSSATSDGTLAVLVWMAVLAVRRQRGRHA